jgi:hypothetical protein
MRSFSIGANVSSAVAAMPRSPTTTPTPDTEPEGRADTDEQTSDEEGIEPQKTRVAEYIQRIEKRMFMIISADRKGWMGPYRHDETKKSFAPQLRRLPHHPFSLLLLLDIPVDKNYRPPPPPDNVTLPQRPHRAGSAADIGFSGSVCR